MRFAFVRGPFSDDGKILLNRQDMVII